MTRRIAPRLSLATQIMVLQLVVVIVAGAVGVGLGVQQLRTQITKKEGARVMAVAESVAGLPIVQQAMTSPHPTRVLQPLAESVRAANDLAFVVIADRNQIRLTHPDRKKIGQKLSTDASDALAGRHILVTERGTLGPSVRAKVPILNAAGAVIGVVSVGSLVERIGVQVREALPRLVAYVLLALTLGVIASVLLARRLRRQTFGLDPAEIGRLLAQRNQSLRDSPEGVLVVDGHGRVTLVNGEAVRLLKIPANSAGQLLADLELLPALRDVLGAVGNGVEEIALPPNRVLVLNRKALEVHGRPIGAVTILRDRNLLDDRTRELEQAGQTDEVLKARAHDFSHRMHTFAGLLELGEFDKALGVIEQTSAANDELNSRLITQIGEPDLAALLLAISSLAADLGAELRLSDQASFPAGTQVDRLAMFTVLGNLVDNALSALDGDPGWVDVLLAPRQDGVLIEVAAAALAAPTVWLLRSSVLVSSSRARKAPASTTKGWL